MSLSDHLPKQTKTVEAIYAAYKKAGDTGHMSQTLGVGSIGHECERYLWYCFRQCCKPEFDGRMYRLFETGNLEEARFAKDLRNIGCIVHDVDEDRLEKRTQQYQVLALGGHVKGYLDSVILGLPEAPKTWHVGEFKTHNAKSFRQLLREGVEKSKPLHYSQMQMGMHLTGMKRALYLARNKDTDELYSERVKYHEGYAKALMDRARRIIVSNSPPDRISSRPDFYQCRWCDARDICFGLRNWDSAFTVPSLSCRQCCHATPITEQENNDAAWRCEKRRDYFAGGRIPCADHLVLPGLLESFAKPVDFSGDYITFENENGAKWQHGSAEGCFSSQELMKLPAAHLGNETIQKVKDIFGGTVTDCQGDILSRYPETDSRNAWSGAADDLLAAWSARYAEDLTKLKPVARFCNLPEYDVAELEGGRIVIVWQDGTAEIREGIK